MRNGFTQKEAANQIGVHPSTVSRELSRKTGARGCRPQQANRIACMMIKQASEALLDEQGELLYVGPISRNQKDTTLAHHRAINDGNIKTAYKAIEHYASSINNNLNDKG